MGSGHRPLSGTSQATVTQGTIGDYSYQARRGLSMTVTRYFRATDTSRIFLLMETSPPALPRADSALLIQGLNLQMGFAPLGGTPAGRCPGASSVSLFTRNV